MNWKAEFDEREQRLISNCVNHAKDDPAGLPGHNLILIIAKMAHVLNVHETALDMAVQELNSLSNWDELLTEVSEVDNES